MPESQAHGKHVFLDFVGYEPQSESDGAWMLDLLERAVERSEARNVHAHVAQFDGSVSPIGLLPSCCWTKATSLPIAIPKKAGWQLIALLAGKATQA